MKDSPELSPAAQKQREEALIRFQKNLKQRPEVSDEEFMSETEVSDEEYKIGLVFTCVGNNEGDVDV
jgi:hypothetical protein